MTIFDIGFVVRFRRRPSGSVGTEFSPLEKNEVTKKKPQFTAIYRLGLTAVSGSAFNQCRLITFVIVQFSFSFFQTITNLLGFDSASGSWLL